MSDSILIMFRKLRPPLLKRLRVTPTTTATCTFSSSTVKMYVCVAAVHVYVAGSDPVRGRDARVVTEVGPGQGYNSCGIAVAVGRAPSNAAIVVPLVGKRVGGRGKVRVVICDMIILFGAPMPERCNRLRKASPSGCLLVRGRAHRQAQDLAESRRIGEERPGAAERWVSSWCFVQCC